MPDTVDEQKKNARDIIENKINDCINNKDDIYLLINPRFGAGKTITTANTLIKSDKQFAFLLPNHKSVLKFLDDPNLISNDIFHLQGRLRLCKNPMYFKLNKLGIKVQKLLCDKEDGSCTEKENCEYLQQFTKIKEEKLSIATVDHYINTKAFQDFGFDVIVLDEYPFDAFNRLKNISKNNLFFLKRIVSEIEDTSEYKTNKDICYYFCNLIDASVNLIEYTEKKGIKLDNVVKVDLQELMDVFFDGFHGMYELKSLLENDDYKYYFIETYSKYVNDMIERNTIDKLRHFNDILENLIDILFILFEHNGKNVNLPVVCIRDNNKTTIKYRDYEFKVPDKTKLIILDATGKKSHYEAIIKKEFDTCTPEIHSNEKIIQFTNAKYTIETLKYEKSRKRLYDSLLQFINAEGTLPVYVFTMKSFSSIENETPETKGMSFEQYVIDNDGPIERMHYEYYHFGKGLNIHDFTHGDGGILICIGTQTISPNEGLDNVRAMFPGEDLITNDRIIEKKYIDGKKNPMYGHDYRYKNPIYDDYVQVHRENVIEHTIGRTRGNPNSIIIVASCIPLNIDSKKLSLKQFNNAFGLTYYEPNKLIFDAVKFIDENKQVSFTDFYNKFKDKKMKNYGFENVKDFRDTLEAKKLYKILKTKDRKKIMVLTPTGKNLVKGLE